MALDTYLDVRSQSVEIVAQLAMRGRHRLECERRQSLQHKERTRRVARKAGTNALAPIPASTCNAYLIAPDDLAGAGFPKHIVERAGLIAIGKSESRSAREGVEVLSSRGDNVAQADGIVNVDEWIHARNLPALEHSSEQRLGRGQVLAWLCAKTAIDLSPCRNMRVFAGRLVCEVLPLPAFVVSQNVYRERSSGGGLKAFRPYSKHSISRVATLDGIGHMYDILGLRHALSVVHLRCRLSRGTVIGTMWVKHSTLPSAVTQATVPRQIMRSPGAPKSCKEMSGSWVQITLSSKCDADPSLARRLVFSVWYEREARNA
jgi:hypothetical protein